MLVDDRHNSWSRFAIPHWRTLRLARGFPEDGSSGRENAIRIHSDYLIRAVLNRRRPFRILTQRKARHAEDSGFLLYSAGVCEDNTCPWSRDKNPLGLRSRENFFLDIPFYRTVRGLNHNHNHDLKNLFKGAAISASTRPGPLYDFYVALVEKGIRPTMARLTLARKIAAITLTIWKKGVEFDAKQLNRQAA